MWASSLDAFWAFDPCLILLALLLDFLIGDPRWLPHVVRYTGFCVNRLEAGFRRIGCAGVVGGAVFYAAILACVFVPAAVVHHLAYLVHPTLAALLRCFLIFQCVAYRDLVRHLWAIIRPLQKGDLLEARRALSWVVGRDTDKLDEPEICRGAVEALAESSSDGVYGPLFWAVLLGPVGALLFRVTNTLDSMVGHRDERYERFGKVSARMDDLLGLIPARLSALLLWLALPTRKLLPICRDARLHNSPNAGWPEATVARCLGVRLGGTNYYDGEAHVGAVFNRDARRPEAADMRRALSQSARALAIASAALVVAAALGS